MTEEIRRVTAAWDRVEAWLQAHAPASALLLRPPASAGDIAAAQDALGVELPDTLAAWYRLRDGSAEGHGSGFLPSGMMMLPLDQLVEEYRTHTEDWEREEGILPFARTAGDIWSGWYVDARKGEPTYGALGHWSVDGGDEPYPSGSHGWPLADWLEELAAALEGGRCLHQPDGTQDAHDWPALTAERALAWIDPRDPRSFPDGMSRLDGPR
ncbi:SMI1/KNR4 family protein [Streptomyces luteocolor]|uniref:SMI1/KNR4 family protein n=1 Tax=Streptomyces luteocolor TaxID=285500 RepID=UPI0008528D9B|nr:SMI1/KNR4 family protein [Streptomyces luteocolor]